MTPDTSSVAGRWQAISKRLLLWPKPHTQQTHYWYITSYTLTVTLYTADEPWQKGHCQSPLKGVKSCTYQQWFRPYSPFTDSGKYGKLHGSPVAKGCLYHVDKAHRVCLSCNSSVMSGSRHLQVFELFSNVLSLLFYICGNSMQTSSHQYGPYILVYLFAQQASGIVTLINVC